MSAIQTRVAIIGAGLSGLCVATALRRAGIEDFVILDKGEDVGGTWRDNTYPGCTCDVPSLLYSFSFAPNPNWSRHFAPQPEIHRYTHEVAEREGVLAHIRFGTAVLGAAWDEHARRWRLDTTAGPCESQVVVAGAGPWHEPLIPDLPGLEDFTGTMFHSSRWDHDHDLNGRRVAVIGTGASAVQFVPEIQPQVEQLIVFQRTPHWVLPKPDRPLSAVERLLLRYPFAHRLLRGGLFNIFELFNAGLRRPQVVRQLQRLGELNLRLGVRDAQLRAQLTPRFALGCKRVLISNDWYPALTRPNVTVVPAAVREVRPTSVIDARGDEHEVDTIILGTGFHILDMPVADLIRGRDGRTLSEVWDGSPRAYLGSTVSGFPNAFVVLGPNIGINTSATLLMEYQARYIVDALHTMDRDRVEIVDVKHEAQDAFNAAVDDGLRGTVWSEGGCSSYFIDANGRNGFNYPWSARRLERELRTFDIEAYNSDEVREPQFAQSLPTLRGADAVESTVR
jgi:cation diffusion facilitator CzcD-associated flavoprotein CzcO